MVPEQYHSLVKKRIRDMHLAVGPTSKLLKTMVISGLMPGEIEEVSMTKKLPYCAEM